jgi:hypothetical protein
MSKPVFLNRRIGYDRRIFNTDPELDFRGTERRSPASSDYVVVMGKGGIDAFGLTIALPIVALLVVAITGNFMAS